MERSSSEVPNTSSIPPPDLLISDSSTNDLVVSNIGLENHTQANGESVRSSPFHKMFFWTFLDF